MSFHKNLITDHAMKKIFTLSTGIVFLITILIAGGCKSANDDMVSNGNVVYNKVIIYLRSVEINGEKHLYMYDSNGSSSLDSLITDVKPGAAVYWELERNSGIKKIKNISSSHGKRNIFKEDPSGIFLSKAFMLKLSDDVKDEEKYTIEYILEDNTRIIIDPYLRIKP
jgi:hypothetical protein